MSNKKYIKYKLDRVFTTNVIIEVHEDVDLNDVDNLIFPFYDEGELENLDWKPHFSQNSFTREEIELTDLDKSEEFSTFQGNLFLVSSNDDGDLEILKKD